MGENGPKEQLGWFISPSIPLLTYSQLPGMSISLQSTKLKSNWHFIGCLPWVRLNGQIHLSKGLSFRYVTALLQRHHTRIAFCEAVPSQRHPPPGSHNAETPKGIRAQKRWPRSPAQPCVIKADDGTFLTVHLLRQGSGWLVS